MSATSLVGRATQLHRLTQHIEDLRRGCGGLVLVGGEAGIGKTSLVQTARSTSGGDVPFAVGRCPEGGATAPFGPWRDALEELGRMSATLSVPSLPWDPRPAGQPFHETGRTLMDWLGQLGRPPVILLEDLQWADPASLELLRVVAIRLPRVPGLVLATYRTDGLHPEHPLWTLLPELQRYGADRIVLPRMSGAEVQALVTRIIPDRGLALRAGPAIYQRCQGVPLFARELAEQVAQEGLRDVARLPDTVLQAIDSRLAYLAPDVRRILEPAAVIGEQFSYDLLRAVAREPEERLGAVLQQALARQVLRPTSTADVFLFDHSLVREAVLAKMAVPTLRHWHRRVAEALAAVDGGDADRVAYHLLQANDPRAVRALLEAGTRAYHLGAIAQAGTRFLEAVARADENHPDRAELLLKLGVCLRWTDTDAAERHLVEASRTALAQGAPAVHAWAQHELALIAQQQSRPVLEQMAAVLAEEQSLLDDPQYLRIEAELFGEPAGWPRVAVPYAMGLAIAGQLQAAQALVARIETSAQAVTGHDLEYARLTLSFLQGNYGEMPMHASLASRQALAAGDYRPAVLFKCHELLFTLLLMPGDRERADRLAAQLKALEAQAHDRAGHALLSRPFSTVGIMQFFRGQWRWARRNLIECALTEREDAPDPILLLAAELALEEGDLERAGLIASYLRPFAPGDDAPFGTAQALAHGLKARVFALAGDLTSAQTWLRAGREQPSAGTPLMGGDLLITEAVLKERRGDAQGAMAAALAARALAAEASLRWHTMQAQRVAARTLAALGRHDGAEALWQEALRSSREAHHRALEGLLHLDRARLAPTRAAREHSARAAHDIFLEVGSPPLAQTAASLASSGPATATPREREIGRLVARGLTDREIARWLHISPRTVDRHLRNVFRKLGVSNRAALAAYVVRRGWN